MAYAPHQQRVIDEKSQLDERLSKLTEFVTGNEMFNSLPLDERARLRRQRRVMREYSEILGERIAAF